MPYFKPVRLEYEGTVTGSGGEWKMCKLFDELGIDFTHAPFGVLSAPDFEVRFTINFNN